MEGFILTVVVLHSTAVDGAPKVPPANSLTFVGSTLIPELELKRSLAGIGSETQVFKGMKGAKTSFDDILNELKITLSPDSLRSNNDSDVIEVTLVNHGMSVNDAIFNEKSGAFNHPDQPQAGRDTGHLRSGDCAAKGKNSRRGPDQRRR